MAVIFEKTQECSSILSEIVNKLEVVGRNYFGEFNNSITRSHFKRDLENAVAESFVWDYCVICDETNNDPKITNVLKAKITFKENQNSSITTISMTVGDD